MISEYSFKYTAAESKTMEPMMDMEIKIFCEVKISEWTAGHWDRFDHAYYGPEWDYSIECGSVEISIGGWKTMEEDFSKIRGQLREIIRDKIKNLGLSDFGITERDLLEEMAE
jgi:hypothetical protein